MEASFLVIEVGYVVDMCCKDKVEKDHGIHPLCMKLLLHLLGECQQLK